MNILLFDERDLDGKDSNEIVLRDRRAIHVRKILKLDAGSKIRIGRIGGQTGYGEILVSTTDEVRISFKTLGDLPPPPSPIELILALPRPKSLKRTMRAVSNLGIKSIHLINSVRVEKPYWTAPVLDAKIMRETLLDGLSIARDTVLPTVKLHRLFKPFVQDTAPHLVEDFAFVAHPNADQRPRLRTKRSTSTLIPVAIGPEGGFSDYEVGLFREAGFETLSLGDRIYSVECAVPVLESMIRAHLGFES